MGDWVTFWFVYIESSRTESHAHCTTVTTARSIINITIYIFIDICSPCCWSYRFNYWMWKWNIDGIIGTTQTGPNAAWNDSVSTNPCEAPPWPNKMPIILGVASKGSWCKCFVAPWLSYVLISITWTCMKQKKLLSIIINKNVSSNIARIHNWNFEHHPYREEKHNGQG